MSKSSSITTLFVDIGGVLLTNGWDRGARKAAAEKFHLDREEMDERHYLTFDTYEEGKLTLDEYLGRVVFHRPRPFSRREFRDFMFAQSQPYPQMIDLTQRLKAQYGLGVVAVSNEGRELTVYRVEQFQLRPLIDFFVCSCFVHYRKPDADIYRIALELAQVEPGNVVYLEDRELFVEVAGKLGISAIRHTDLQSTRTALAQLGLVLKAES
jgi:putative hydrolase of the HAD superfamily